MGYQFTQLGYFFRKIIKRNESKKGNLSKLIRIFIVGFVPLYLIAIFNPVILQYEQFLLEHTFYIIRGNRPAPQEIVLVKIDDQSFENMKLNTKEPIPRLKFAEALAQIQTHKPKLVILDLHAAPSPKEEEGTLIAIEAIKKGPTTIALSLVDHEIKSVNDPRIIKAAAMEVPMIVASNSQLKLVDQINITSNFKNESVPLLQPLKTYVDSNLITPGPFDLINFYGDKNSIRSFSLWEFFSEESNIPSNFFKDKIVVIGLASNLAGRSANNIEVFNTPIKDFLLFGVEIHANIIGNLLDQSWIKNFSPGIKIILLMTMNFIALFIIALNNPKQSLTKLSLFLISYFIISYLAFTKFNTFIPGFYIIIFLSLFYFAGHAYIIANQALKELEETKKMLGLKK